MTTRKQPKQARSRELVRAVLQAAARVFDREGLHATTNRIAEEAGVSIGSLYQYFPNKETLLHALAESHLDRARASLGAALTEAQSAESLEEALRYLVIAIATEHQNHPSTQALMRDIAPGVPELWARFRQLQQELETAILQMMTQHCPEHPCSPLRARIAVYAVEGALHGTVCDDVSNELWTHELVSLAHSYLISP